MPTISKDHRFITAPTSTGAILWSLLKSGKSVTVKEINKELKAKGRKVADLQNRIYWFDKWCQELGLETEQQFGDDNELTSLKLIKSSKKAKPSKESKPKAKSKSKSKPAKKEKSKPKTKKKSKTAKESASESESAESESASESVDESSETES